MSQNPFLDLNSKIELCQKFDYILAFVLKEQAFFIKMGEN
jgi:hypothetical protein